MDNSTLVSHGWSVTEPELTQFINDNGVYQDGVLSLYRDTHFMSAAGHASTSRKGFLAAKSCHRFVSVRAAFLFLPMKEMVIFIYFTRKFRLTTIQSYITTA